ncbi:MAG: hypothetical protein KAS46_00580 [Candidatus Aureabacteria bacterium]|nr:hypothetical protein [Candidatus Auribacterota bacterium]
MHIGFDNSARLYKNVYYFEYKGIQYKLIQNNPRKWCDVLITIIPSYHDKKLKNRAYNIASEFISALSWENFAMATVSEIGGSSAKDNICLRNAKCNMFDLPKIPYLGSASGNNISRMPKIENEGQRTALTLYRQALSSNNDYLSFLFFWQVLEVGGKNPIGWINKINKNGKIRFAISESDLKRLPLNQKDLGNYFYDDCRNAIAHINRRPGKTKIEIDTREDNIRMSLSVYAIELIARYYIKNELSLNKEMWLVRKKGKGFPIYVDKEYLKNNPCTFAYNHMTTKKLLKKKNQI